MASPFQQQSFQRKIIYVAAIAVLLSGSYVYRHTIVDAKADEINMHEEKLGEVELTGSAIRLSLTGSRGLATCILWVSADNMQKKNQWNELELLVRSITKLQPHFLTPWLFQSWNLAYNVSVESDRVRDKYFFITRGIELLAEGERQNRNQPDLRDTMGFYVQNKIGASDETNTQRSLFQLSLIPPSERNPERFLTKDPKTGKSVLNREVFDEFCKSHPMLVRRLYDKLRYKAEEIVKFLDESQKIPTVFEEPLEGTSAGIQVGSEKLKAPENRFPVVPPLHALDDEQTSPYAPYITDDRSDQFLRDDYSAFENAFGWFAYTAECLPHVAIPGVDEEINEKTRTKLRRPRFTTALFRMHAARAATYNAENLAKEGWYDQDGWTVPMETMFPNQPESRNEKPLVLGSGRAWAKEAWTKSYDAWTRYGETTKLIMSDEEEKRLTEGGYLYRTSYGLKYLQQPVPLRESDVNDPQMVASRDAYTNLQSYNYYREKTNLPTFLFQSNLEREDRIITARKRFSESLQLQKEGKINEAKAHYELPDAIPAWVEILRDAKNRLFSDDINVQEQSVEVQYRYVSLVLKLEGTRFKEIMEIPALIGQTAAPGPWTLAGAVQSSRLIPFPELKGPFDITNSLGEPLIPEDTKMTVLSRHGAAPRRNPRATPPQGPNRPPRRPGDDMPEGP